MSMFFIGFASGALFLIIVCVAFATYKPDFISRKTSKFFTELKGRNIRSRVKQMNGGTPSTKYKSRYQ